VGYDLHITRAKSWALNTKHRISAEEWLAYVEKDPELSLSRDGGPYFAKWSGKSKLNEPWLDWHDGNIETKNPDEALIDKMVVIADELGATVQGDDGEIYRSGHEPPRHPQPSVLDRLRYRLRALLPARPLKIASWTHSNELPRLSRSILNPITDSEKSRFVTTMGER
jgi:hypothetical protein